MFKFKSPKLNVEKKYQLYESSVQNPDGDIEFVNKQYQAIFKKKPLTLREDFAGTALLSTHWVQQSPKHEAWGVDLDPVPLDYGKRFHLLSLAPEAQKRMHFLNGNVLDNFKMKTDVVVAFNFSYFHFKKRKELLEYFKKVRKSLNSKGAFFLDLFGGTEAFQEGVEETKHDGHVYFWDCDKFNPITNECVYYIHFKEKGIKYEKVFTYDWRMWSIPELKEILEDAGFSKVFAFWEGDAKDGTGDGNFYVASDEENCLSWVTYMMAVV